MILVTGATGTVGGHVLRQLTESGAPVRALVRSPERADTLRGYDCDIAIGDYDDSDSLDHALRRVSSVFLLGPTGEPMADQEIAMLRAVRGAATEPHVVVLAAAGVDAAEPSPVRIVRQHQQVLEALRDLEVRHTVLAPNGFFQNLLTSAAGIAGGELAMPAGDGAVSHVDARDVAAVAAHVLTSSDAEGPSHDGAIYTITGPEALTYAEIARRLSEALGRDVRYVDVPAEAARASMIDHGVPEWVADGLIELNAVYAAGQADMVTDEVTKATGRPARSFEDFLGDHRAVFG